MSLAGHEEDADHEDDADHEEDADYEDEAGEAQENIPTAIPETRLGHGTLPYEPTAG